MSDPRVQVRDFYLQLADELVRTAGTLESPADDVLIGVASSIRATVRVLDKRTGRFSTGCEICFAAGIYQGCAHEEVRVADERASGGSDEG